MFKAGIVGNVWSLETLRNGIRRQRGKCGPGSTKFAKVLGEKLDELANRRWRRATKGQRVPTVRQAMRLFVAIRDKLEQVQGRSRERLVSVQTVIATARQAGQEGLVSTDGGKVTASSYGYRWTTTGVYAKREMDGTISVEVSRTGIRNFRFPAKWFASVSAHRQILAGGGDFAIKRKHGWDCYTLDGVFVGVAVRVLDKVVRDRFGAWEHGKTVAEAQAEIARKRAIIDAEAAKKAESEKAAAKLERASRLLARLGTKASVSYDDARAVGACDPGIRAFADRIGRPITATITLAEIAKVEPAWAVKLARRILTAKAN